MKPSNSARRLPTTVAIAFMSLAVVTSRAADAPYKSVSELKKSHDKTLMGSLEDYLKKNPKAEDRDEAYTLLFDTAIEHDWFAETDADAKRYLTEQPEGAVRPLARIVMTMARAHSGNYKEALTIYKDLMAGLDKPEQEEFASNFADNLATSATSAGEFAVAREVYKELLGRFKDSDALKQKVKDDLARLDRVGRPAPALNATDLYSKPVKLADFKGKYVLIDFWATWCAPCIAELPNLQAAYAKHHDKGFEIVAVSLDENPDAVIDFVKSRKLPWKQIHAATAGSDLVAAYGVSNIPASFLISPEGVVVRLEMRGSALDETLGKLMKKK